MIRRLLAVILSVCAVSTAAQARAPVVLAAASLQGSLDEAAAAWARKGHGRPVISYAASSALARQALAGAPADLFVSADEAWMDALAARGLLAKGTRADLLGNRLVIVGGPAAAPVAMRGPDLARTLARGALAMADPGAVPAGRYGQAALTRLGAWSAVAPRVVRAENVRAALALVERGAAPYGIVYATDARASRLVRIVGVFPAASHPPIVYPIARLAASRNPDGEDFRRFLLSPEGRTIFVRHGFTAH